MPDTFERIKAALADRYAIERELGQGGMATVYLAHDLKHDRKVAIKVLRPELAAVLGAERFVQEIKTTANLQHPHILPLFDSGEAQGFLYYVMPYIEGETIRGKLNREKQLGIEEAVTITTEVADALDYAHRHNVIHRDIKPENILLHDGRPMVADFGIALAVSAAAGGRMTETGLSLGTPHYMSPEQATAEKDITHRSDIYSLGSVLYEMLTGEPPHTGGSAQAIILKIVTEEVPPVTTLRKSVPPNVAAATAKALEKLPADRFETAARFAEAMKDPAFAPSIETSAETPAGRRSGRPTHAAVLVASAVILVVLASSIWLAARGASSTGQVQHLPLALREPVHAFFPWSAGVELAPEGNRIAYYTTGSQWQLLDLADGITRPVSSEVRGNHVAFSPSGDSIAHATSAWLQQIYVIDLITGRAIQITDSAQGELKWGDDGWIYYRDQLYGLRRVRVADGKQEVLLRPNATERWYAVNPAPVPGGRGIIYTRVPRAPRNPAQAEIIALDLESGESTYLARGVDADVTASGYLLVAQLDGSLLAGRLDAGSLKLEGPLAPVLEGMEIRELWEIGGAFSVAKDGTLLYVQSRPIPEDTVVVIDRSGQVQRVLPTWGGVIRGLAYSPRDERWATNVHRGLRAPNVLVRAGDDSEPRRLTFGEVLDYYPTFIPATGEVAFVSPREGNNWDLYGIPFDGGRPILLLDRPGDIQFPRFTTDGRWVVFCEASHTGERDVAAHHFEPDSATVTLVATPAQECRPDVSPDTRWLAYESDESGRWEVYVQAFGEHSKARWQVSTDGGTAPRWGTSGRELFYVNAQREIVAVPVLGGATFSFGSPQALFRLDEGSVWSGEFTARDQEFIVLRRQREAPGQVVLIRNFLELLKEKVGN